MQLRLDNGSNVVYNALGLENQCVQPNEELNVTIEVKLPANPGKNVLKFRLVHGSDNQEFGEEVTVDLITEVPAAVEVSATPVPVVEEHPVMKAEEPLIETSGTDAQVNCPQGDMDEFDCESIEDDDLSVNSWTEVNQEK